PLPLLRRRLEVAQLAVRGGRVELAKLAEGGTALDRVFSQAQPPGPKAPVGQEIREPLPPAPPWPIELVSLRLEKTAFRLSDRPGGRASVLVKKIDAAASGAWRGHFARVEMRLRGDALLP